MTGLNPGALAPAVKLYGLNQTLSAQTFLKFVEVDDVPSVKLEGTAIHGCQVNLVAEMFAAESENLYF